MRIGRQGKRRRVYWDSCTFLAWITGETMWGQDVIDGMEQLVTQVYANQAVIITSVITKTEVLEGDLTPDQKKQFAAVFGHRNVVLVAVDQRISGKAAVIREYYRKPNVRTLSLPDSIHLATAIQYEVDEFHTLDGAGKRKRPLDLLSLNGNVAGSRLCIIKPTYVPPLPPLEGPIEAVVGEQGKLFDQQPGEAHEPDRAEGSIETKRPPAVEEEEQVEASSGVDEIIEELEPETTEPSGDVKESDE